MNEKNNVVAKRKKHVVLAERCHINQLNHNRLLNCLRQSKPRPTYHRQLNYRRQSTTCRHRLSMTCRRRLLLRLLNNLVRLVLHLLIMVVNLLRVLCHVVQLINWHLKALLVPPMTYRCVVVAVVVEADRVVVIFVVVCEVADVACRQVEAAAALHVGDLVVHLDVVVVACNCIRPLVARCQLRICAVRRVLLVKKIGRAHV